MSRWRRAAAIGGVLLGLLAALATWRWPRPAPPVPVSAPDPPAAAPAVAVPPRSAAPASAPITVFPRAPAVAGSRPLRPGEIDLCGVGIVQGEPVNEPGQPQRFDLPKAIEEKIEQQLEQQWIPALRRSAGSAAEAAAALLQKRTGDLVRLALRSRDPRTVQWAFQACQRGGEPDCVLLPQRLWVELEPDNGHAWLMLMSADPAAQTDALYRLTLARHFDEHVGALAAAVDRALPASAPPHERASMLVHAMDVELALPSPSYGVLVQACDRPQLDANRRQQCGAIAELLAGESQSVIARQTGARLGEQIGWPAERVAALRLRVAQARERAARNFDEALKLPAHGCAHTEALARPIRDTARLGEWRALTQPAR